MLSWYYFSWFGNSSGCTINFHIGLSTTRFCAQDCAAHGVKNLWLGKVPKNRVFGGFASSKGCQMAQTGVFSLFGCLFETLWKLIGCTLYQWSHLPPLLVLNQEGILRNIALASFALFVYTVSSHKDCWNTILWSHEARSVQQCQVEGQRRH